MAILHAQGNQCCGGRYLFGNTTAHTLTSAFFIQ
jgi:hypothetical protein